MFPAERCPGVRCRRQQGLFFKLHINKEQVYELSCERFTCLLHNRYTDSSYLSDQFLFLGRLWHAVDLLEQLSEGRFSITLSINWAAGDAMLPSGCLYGGRGGGRWYRRQGSNFLPRAECQIILERLNNHVSRLDFNFPSETTSCVRDTKWQKNKPKCEPNMHQANQSRITIFVLCSKYQPLWEFYNESIKN